MAEITGRCPVQHHHPALLTDKHMVLLAFCADRASNGISGFVFAKEILANPNSSVPHCHCATIAVHTSGEALVAWYGYPESETKDGTIILARRKPGAKLFEKPQRILGELNQSQGNPVLFFDEFGVLHLLFVILRGH